MLDAKDKVLAFGKRLKKCKNVITLGVKVNFDNYSCYEKKMIFDASKIYYPSSFYVGLLKSYGKKVFPNLNSYMCAQDKIKQSTLFQMQGLPHPKTRFFYGKKEKKKILDHFGYPFIAKIPKGSAFGRGVFIIHNIEDLEKYLNSSHVAYIQQYLPIDRDMRIVVIGERIVHAYWRIAKSGEFRTNVALGGRISLDPVPYDALRLALKTALICNWNDVGIDICHYKGCFYLLEANMKYGCEGFEAAGIDYFKLMEEIIQSGRI